MTDEELAKVAKRDDVFLKEGENDYGDVEFADSVNKKYPIDTAEHVRATLRYIGQERNRSKYDAKDLATIEKKIYAGARKFGIDTSTTKSVRFNFFTDLSKTYEEDGLTYIEGVASGTTRDSDKEKMTLSALKCMKKSVDDGVVAEDGSLVKVYLRDAHKNDGVLRDLGDVVEASITPENTLYIKAVLRIDENSAAESLAKQLKKGRKYGFSVAGIINNVTKSWDEDLQAHIRAFTDVSLEEVSVTSRPSWSPSLGTVLTKSMKDYINSEEVEADAETTEEENPQIMKKENLQETSEAEVKLDTKPLETEQTTETVNAEAEAVEKAKKDSVKPAHFALMQKKALHIAGHLGDLAAGRSNAKDELSHLQGHAKDFAKSMGSLANGDTSALDEEMGDDVNPMPFYLSETETMTEDKIKKSDEAEVAAVEPKVEETAVEEKTEKSTQPDLAELIKSAVEAATKPLLEKVENISKELEAVKSAPVGDPKGFVAKSATVETSVDTSRVIEKEKTQESLEQRIQKAVKENPLENPTKVAVRIMHGLDAFGNPAQE